MYSLLIDKQLTTWKRMSLSGWKKHGHCQLNRNWARVAERNMSLSGWTKHEPERLKENMSLNGWMKHEPGWLKTQCKEGIEAEWKGKAATTRGHCCDNWQSSHAETIAFSHAVGLSLYTRSSRRVLREHPQVPYSTNRFFCKFWPPRSWNNRAARTCRLHQA